MIMLNFIKTIPFNAIVSNVQIIYHRTMAACDYIGKEFLLRSEFCTKHLYFISNRRGILVILDLSVHMRLNNIRFFTIIGIGRGRRCVTRESGNREDAEKDFSSTEDVEGVEEEDVPPKRSLDSEVVKTLYSSVVSFCIN
ncbi:unnamed protein product [Rhizophagus irregularis]|nr:unnamed protein product [Rhizophagus irregularis]CAB4408397.1 unnamed protein product [Rhizophagus irregularis]